MAERCPLFRGSLLGGPGVYSSQLLLSFSLPTGVSR